MNCSLLKPHNEWFGKIILEEAEDHFNWSARYFVSYYRLYTNWRSIKEEGKETIGSDAI